MSTAHLTTCQPLDPAVEETFALAAHRVGYAVGPVEQVCPGHAAAQRLRGGIAVLGAKPAFGCDDCGQIRPAEDFALIPTGEEGRRQPYDARCTPRARARVSPGVESSR